MTFTFIRHLPTAWNQQGLLQGQCDEPILAIDAQTLQKISANLKQLEKLVPFDQVFCSKLQRTRQTAEAYGFQATADIRLNEIAFGEYEGRKRDDMLAEIGEQWFNCPSSLVLGEPLSGLLERIQSFIEEYQDQGNILVFAHGSWMRAARAWYVDGSLDSMNREMIANNAMLQIQVN